MPKGSMEKPVAKRRSPPSKDDFESVARRLECATDLKKFDAKLRKIAKVKIRKRMVP